MPTANELYQQAKVAGNVSFQAEWGRTQQQLAKLSQGERVSQLGFSSLEPGEFMMAYDSLGQARMRIGHQSDGTVGVIYGNGKPPPVPSAPSVGARQLGVFIGWDGVFADGYAKPGDFARIDVHMSEEQGFLPDGTTIVGTIVQEGGILVGADSVTHYVKLVAVNTSDVPSAATAQIAVLPLPAGQIAAGAIGAQQLAADIAMLSRLVVGNPTAARLEVDGRVGATAPGMALYDTSGAETFKLNALTGDVSMKGTLRTADSGNRIVLRESGQNDIRFYENSTSLPARLYQSSPVINGVAYAGIGLVSSLTENARASAFVMPSYVYLNARDETGTSLNHTIWVDRNELRFEGSTFRSTATNFTVQGTNFIITNSTVDVSASSSMKFRSQGTLIEIGKVGTNQPLLNASALATGILYSATGIDVYNSTSGAYKEVRASNIASGSARELKDEIEEFPFDPERTVAAAPSMMWEYRAEQMDDKGRRRKGRARKRLGPMVDDLPDMLRRPIGPDGAQLGVDLNGLLAVLWAATGQQTSRLDAIEARLTELEGAA